MQFSFHFINSKFENLLMICTQFTEFARFFNSMELLIKKE